MTHRHKTDTPVNVPILDIPMELIERYRGQSKKGYILPILSNQKMNQYLKDVAEVCGIEKNITFHCFRHHLLSYSLKISSLYEYLYKIGNDLETSKVL